MKRDAPLSPEGFLSRWSRLKREQAPDAATIEEVPSPLPELADPVDQSIAAATTTTPTPTTHAGAAVPPPLPAVDTLTFDSDYTAFLQPRVPDELRRAAVKKLFTDPHFNVMDGLDVYIDDYSKPDPLPEGWLEKIAHARDLIDHPSNRKPAAGEKPTAAEASTSTAGEAPVGEVIADKDATSECQPTGHGVADVETPGEDIAPQQRSDASIQS
jgi:hypothetical protein